MRSSDAHYLIFTFPDYVFGIAAAVTSKTTTAHIKADLMNRVFPNKLRAKQYPAYILGKAYWAEDRNFNIDSHLITVKQSISTLDELGAFAGSVAIQPFPANKPRWCMYVIEDFQGDSAVVLRFHHSYMDGVSMVNALVHNSDPACSRAFFTFGKANFTQRLLATPAALLKVPSGMIAGFNLAPDENPLMSSYYSGDKAMAIVPPLPLEPHLARAKALGVTFNDYITAAVLRAISAFIAQKYGVQHHLFKLGMPFTLRGHPSDGSPLPPANDVAYLILPMPNTTSPTLEADISTAIKQITASPALLRSSDLITRLLALVPTRISRKFLRVMGDKVTVALSNIQGPKANLSYGGVEIKSLFAAPVAAMPITAAVISYAGHFSLAFTTDTAVIQDSKELARLIHTELTKTPNRSL